ncbi:MAG: hypothetical protein IKU82_05310, partial [Clostridia bacterium]|nr:hypothetical protein [Clostridia bacterium]
STNISEDFSTVGLITTPSFKLALSNKSWTKGDNVATVGSMVFSSSWACYVTDFIAGSMRHREIKKSMPDVIKDIKGQFPDLRVATFAAIEEVYSTMQINVKKLILDYFNEQITSLEAQVEQATAISRQSEEKKQEIETAVSELSTALNNICKDLSISVGLQDS